MQGRCAAAHGHSIICPNLPRKYLLERFNAGDRLSANLTSEPPQQPEYHPHQSIVFRKVSFCVDDPSHFING
jgi:hypothetical protein